jgi:hypothetical protein
MMDAGVDKIDALNGHHLFQNAVRNENDCSKKGAVAIAIQSNTIAAPLLLLYPTILCSFQGRLPRPWLATRSQIKPRVSLWSWLGYTPATSFHGCFFFSLFPNKLT